jgi:hypothetical protein
MKLVCPGQIFWASLMFAIMVRAPWMLHYTSSSLSYCKKLAKKKNFHRKHTGFFCGSLSDGEKKLNKIDTKAKLDSNMDLWAENHAFANWKKSQR